MGNPKITQSFANACGGDALLLRQLQNATDDVSCHVSHGGNRARSIPSSLWYVLTIEMKRQRWSYFNNIFLVFLRSKGNSEENLYKLLTFGIPNQDLPVTAEGEPKVKSHRQWLKNRRSQEDAHSSSEVIVVPGRLDILLGRGKPIQEHFGNLRYHVLLDYYQPAYERAKKFDKMQIAQRIVNAVHEYSGKFLKQEGAGWVAVDDVVARDKVSHAFRTRRAPPCTTTDTSRNGSAPLKRPKEEKEPQSVLPNGVTSSGAVTTVPVTDTEEHGLDDSSSEEFNGDGGKRARLWDASFHAL